MSKIISALLALLGFAACDKNDKAMYGPPPVMYGIPETSFVIKGAVTDAEEKPLENIRVVLKLKDDDPIEGQYDRRVYRDTVYTDSQGKFQTDLRPVVPLPMELIATDLDGAENGGEFEGRTEEFIIGDDWYFEGNTLIKRKDFTLSEKGESDENE